MVIRIQDTEQRSRAIHAAEQLQLDLMQAAMLIGEKVLDTKGKKKFSQSVVVLSHLHR